MATIIGGTPSTSPWLDINGAADYTGIPVSTIYKDKTIPRHKPAGRLAFHRDELDAYMRGQTGEVVPLVRRGKE